MKLKRVFSSVAVISCGLLFMGGCPPTPTDDYVEGYLVDSPISGANYACIEGTGGITDEKGKFKCKNIPVTFKVGGLELGTISSLADDKKVYPQDLVGVSRENYSDDRLILLTRFLQSLDDDGFISENIKITKEIGDKFSIGEFSDLSEDEVKNLLGIVGKSLVSEESALSHLRGSVTISPKEGGFSLSTYSEGKLHFSVDIRGLGISKGDKLRVSTLAYSDKDDREADYGDGLEFIAQNSDSLDVNISDFTFSLLTDEADKKAINELPIQDRSRRMFEIIGKRPYQGLSMCIQKVTKDNGHVINGQTYYGNVIGECQFVSNKNYVIHSPFSLKSSKVESQGDKKKVSIQVEGTIHENTVIFFEYVKTGLPILPYWNSLAKVYVTKESDNSISFIIPDNITEGEQNIVVVTFGKDGYSQVARLDFSL